MRVLDFNAMTVNTGQNFFDWLRSKEIKRHLSQIQSKNKLGYIRSISSELTLR